MMEDDDGYEAILRRPVDKHCTTCNVLRGAFEDIISDLKLELAIVGMQVMILAKAPIDPKPTRYCSVGSVTTIPTAAAPPPHHY